MKKCAENIESTLNFIHVKRGGKKFQIEEVTKVVGRKFENNFLSMMIMELMDVARMDH